LLKWESRDNITLTKFRGGLEKDEDTRLLLAKANITKTTEKRKKSRKNEIVVDDVETTLNNSEALCRRVAELEAQVNEKDNDSRNEDRH